MEDKYDKYDMEPNPFIDDELDPDADQTRALFAIAWELRTANLIAANQRHQDDKTDDTIRERLGLPAWSFTLGG